MENTKAIEDVVKLWYQFPGGVKSNIKICKKNAVEIYLSITPDQKQEHTFVNIFLQREKKQKLSKY